MMLLWSYNLFDLLFILFYFFISKKSITGIGIGFCEKTENIYGNHKPFIKLKFFNIVYLLILSFITMLIVSWSYHGDGNFFSCSKSGKFYGPTFTTGDTIGCFLNFRQNTVFYTKNGVHLGFVLRDLKGILYPYVEFWSQGGSVEVNFGHKKFEYSAITDNDINDVLLKEKWIEALNPQSTNQIDKLYKLAKLIEQKYQGKIFFIMGKYEKALINLTKILDSKPNDPFALKYRGETYYVMKRYKESLTNLNKLLEIKINNEWTINAHKECIRRRDYERRFLDERFLENCDERFLDDTRFEGNEDLREQFLKHFDDNEEFNLRERLERRRNADYGKCSYCNKYNSSWAWCQTCDPEIATQGWTSGNKDIDDCIKEFQLNSLTYAKIIEWIPFDRLINIKKVGKGGFGSVYSVTWLDGIRKIDFKNGQFVRSRKQSYTVALKTLPGSKADFLNEVI